eukprot:SAG31_NODE_1032_length_10231_cov_3.718417_2_plen_1552_part_00
MGDQDAELVWIMTTKPGCLCDGTKGKPDKLDAHYRCTCKHQPKLTDPLQLYSLFEIQSTEGAGEEAMLTCVCKSVVYDQPINFLADFSHVTGHGKENDAISMVEKEYSNGFVVDEPQQRMRKHTMKVNRKEQDLCADLSGLDNMNEAAILHCLRMRYCDCDIEAEMVQSKYVTFIGDICVAVNPFAPYPYAKSTAWVQYDKKNNPDVDHYKFESYLSAKPDVRSNKDLQPHCWSVADLAYNTMQKTTPWKNQAVLICGESGAGKTECCKFVLNYLLAKKGSSVDGLQEKLIATNEPLEAFGNAKTQNNDNSSRFAKCMQLAFDKNGRVLGAEIQTSLLEKARVCAIMPNERGFHIFFMITHYCDHRNASIDDATAKERLGDVAFKFIKLKGETPVKEFALTRVAADVGGAEGDWPGHDAAEFEKVITAFRGQLGYTKQETDQMMSVLVGILYLGECQFEGDGSSAPAKVKNPDQLEYAAECLGLDPDGMAENLGQYSVMMGHEPQVKFMTAAKARSVRDSICKKLFDLTFLNIVAHCNDSVIGESRDSAQCAARIGVLDIFGFERMALNSLEQLCINYTNEKLHQTFINEVFQAEIRVYKEEGLDADAIKFTDNAAVLECISGYNPHKEGLTSKSSEVKRSIFGHMDTETLGSKGDDKKVPAFMEAIMKDPTTDPNAGKCGPAGIKPGHPQWRDDMWKGWGVKNGGWKDAYDNNGPLFQADRFWTIKGTDKFCKFAVVHFAGPVEYTTYAVVKDVGKDGQFECVQNEAEEHREIIDSFITKNADKIEETVQKYFFSGAVADQKPSHNEFYNSIIAEGGDDEAQAVSTKTTVCNKFCLEINAFFDNLLGTGKDKVAPTFIRAINPRPKGIGAPATMGERYNLQRVLNQLRYTGILDTVRVRASGYIMRKKFSLFAADYIFPCNLLPKNCKLQEVKMKDEDFAEKVRSDPNLASQVIDELFGMPEWKIGEAGPETWCKGKTMVFVKSYSVLALLDKRREEMMQNRVTAAIRIRDHLQQYKIRKFWTDTIHKWTTFGTAIPKAQAYAKGLLARQKFNNTVNARAEAEQIRKAEEARLANEARLEAERIAQEEERIAKEQEAARLEAERIARLEAERIAREEERIAKEQEAARLEAERIAKEQEAARLEAERIAKEEAEKKALEAYAAAYSHGMWQRRKVVQMKSQAVKDGVWQLGGPSLLGKPVPSRPRISEYVELSGFSRRTGKEGTTLFEIECPIAAGRAKEEQAKAKQKGCKVLSKEKMAQAIAAGRLAGQTAAATAAVKKVQEDLLLCDPEEQLRVDPRLDPNSLDAAANTAVERTVLECRRLLGAPHTDYRISGSINDPTINGLYRSREVTVNHQTLYANEDGTRFLYWVPNAGGKWVVDDAVPTESEQTDGWYDKMAPTEQKQKGHVHCARETNDTSSKQQKIRVYRAQEPDGESPKGRAPGTRRHIVWTTMKGTVLEPEPSVIVTGLCQTFDNCFLLAVSLCPPPPPPPLSLSLSRARSGFSPRIYRCAVDFCCFSWFSCFHSTNCNDCNSTAVHEHGSGKTTDAGS